MKFRSSQNFSSQKSSLQYELRTLLYCHFRFYRYFGVNNGATGDDMGRKVSVILAFLRK